ncbi:hypothetical protein ACLKA6_015176 [Drosophila palustris]
MIERRSQLDKIIITAMDRFVWFVLLVVMTHLVTEFTRVTGYARGQRQELVLINETTLHPMPVQNMLLYPSREYAQYEQTAGASASASVGGNSLQQNAAMVLSSLGMGGAGAGGSAAGNNAVEPSYPLFSLRPLIDSIFEVSARIYNRSVTEDPCELVTAKTQNQFQFRCLMATFNLPQIPISTLRAVNNLVGRLTGSYRQATAEEVQKSATIRLPPGNAAPIAANLKLSTTRTAAQRQAMREELA